MILREIALATASVFVLWLAPAGLAVAQTGPTFGGFVGSELGEYGAMIHMPIRWLFRMLLQYAGPHTVAIAGHAVSFTIVASGRSVVDWGDGTVASYDVAGTPWPEGLVSHVYQETGEVSVQVTDVWEVRYTVSDPVSVSDVVQVQLEPVSIESFTVNQLQTVRVVPDM